MFTIGRWNPYWKNGNVPGSKVNEGLLPVPSRWNYLWSSCHGPGFLGWQGNPGYISSEWDASGPLELAGYIIYYYERPRRSTK